MKLLDGKLAVVTGAARGIGKATAKLYAEHGANLVLVDIDEQPLNETAEELRAYGTQIVTQKADITNLDNCKQVFVKSKELCQGKGVDILANIAGITRDAVIHKMSESDWDFVIDINLKGTYNMIQASEEAMRALAKAESPARARSIINISSTSGCKGNAGQINYAAAKAGINGLTRTVAKEWARFNIRCNSIAPGFIETRLTSKQSDDPRLGIPDQQMQMIEMLYSQTGLQRAEGMGKPEDIANIALFFASDLSSYVSGQVLIAAGAMIDTY
jgi:3-oxoacyl-[acyl-carrier protein] reductase